MVLLPDNDLQLEDEGFPCNDADANAVHIVEESAERHASEEYKDKDDSAMEMND